MDQSANDSRRDRLPPISHHRRKHRKRDKSKKFQYYIILLPAPTTAQHINRLVCTKVGTSVSGSIAAQGVRSFSSCFPGITGIITPDSLSITLRTRSNRRDLPVPWEQQKPMLRWINHPQHQKQQETTSWAANCVCYIVTASLEKMKKVRTLSSQVANTQKWHSWIITV